MRTCIVYHGPVSTARIADAEGRARTEWRSADALLENKERPDQPSVLLADESMLDRPDALSRVPRHVVIVATDTRSDAALGSQASISLAGVTQSLARERLLTAAFELAAARFRAMRRGQAVTFLDDELHELTRVGIGLMAERDRTVLLHKILDLGKRLTESDAGCLVLAEPGGEHGQRLRLALYEVDSVPDLSPLMSRSFEFDDSTIIGHAALHKELLVIEDAYNLPPDATFEQDPEYDRRLGYHRQSMLIVPMVDHIDCLVGLVLFINRKTDPAAKIRTKEDADRYVIPYTDRQVRIAHSLASHAAVSIENAELYARIERTLESFVKAAVTAIDQHDPTTAGHSLRVAALATELAAAVDRADHGPFASVHFTRQEMRELYFAGLLHDFGKVTVPDDVLLKAKKLPPVMWARIDARFDLIRQSIELAYQRQRARAGSSSDHARTAVAQLDRARADEIERLERFRDVVRDANQPEVVPTPPDPALLELATRTYQRPDGSLAPYLTREELHYLRVSPGTLDRKERAVIETHVDETHRFLADIPWTDDLKNLATFAYGHHEKLNGTGYPRGLRGDDIPIQTRMLTIADAFDALTESDRPYKSAVSPEAALDVLRAEASDGLLDPNLVQLMIDAGVYRKILDEDWHQF